MTTIPRNGTHDGAMEGTLPIDPESGLAKFGFSSFRPGQREAIQTLLEVGRLLLVAPTGGGKSLIYQLPASLLPGTTLVVSPLISLMNDQVLAMERLGIPATFLAATVDGGEIRQRMSDLGRGRYKIVYVAPERLAFPGFRSLVHDLDCPLLAVDEAHCISEWGHDFRPDYLQIGELVQELPRSRILACTATATPVVRDEILARLSLPPTTPQLVRGFARPNLALRAIEVRTKRQRENHTDAVLSEALGEPGQNKGLGIVYAPTRKATEAEADRLSDLGWRSHAYHAGLEGSRRESVHRDFAEGRIDIVVATNAFGMGIDRPDVRVVIHLAPPSSIESYYQEVGRAGRDGDDAIGLLLVSPGDMPLRRRLIESDSGGYAPNEDTIRHKWNLFLELMRWAEGGSCRHDAILRYFGDEEETLAGCGRCDVCRSLEAGGDDDQEAVEVTVKKALSAVARLRGRFGMGVAAKLLRGADDERLRLSGLKDTKTFGTLSDRPEEWTMRLLRRCVTAGWVDFSGGDRPVLLLTSEGRQAVMGEVPIRLLLPREEELRAHAKGTAAGEPRSGRSNGSRSRPAHADDGLELDAAAQALFEELRKHRLELATERSVPPYVIASDRTLREIARTRPRNRSELELVHGIGPAKVEKYGDGLLSVVEESADR